jgi:hypothetical protein
MSSQASSAAAGTQLSLFDEVPVAHSAAASPKGQRRPATRRPAKPQPAVEAAPIADDNPERALTCGALATYLAIGALQKARRELTQQAD